MIHKLLAVHWGWVTPGVPDCNRRLQEAVYLDFLAAEAESGDRFNFTQPGWVLDSQLDDDLTALTCANPEPGFRGGPFGASTMAALRLAVQSRQLTYLAYPYSGMVVEGVSGETILHSYRLTMDVVRRNLGVEPSGFFVHDGPTSLDCNVPAMVQLGVLLGLGPIFGRRSALVESEDGSQLQMIGLRPGSIDGIVTNVVELVDAPEQVESLRAEYDGRFLSVDDLGPASTLAKRPHKLDLFVTKGWYGGTTAVMQMQASLRRSDCLLSALESAGAVLRRCEDMSKFWKRSLILQDCHLQWLLHDVESHYLPCARSHEADLRERLGFLLTETPIEGSRFVYNPLPFDRVGVVRRGDRYRFFPRAPAYGTTGDAIDVDVRVTPTSLENDRIHVDLGGCGEVLSVRSLDGGSKFEGISNRVVRRHNRAASGQFELVTGAPLSMPGFHGCVRLTAEVNAPEAGEYDFSFGVHRGMTVVVEGVDWASAMNRHWGGGLPGSPERPQDWTVGKVELKAGRQNIVISAVSDGGIHLDHATFTRGQHVLSPDRWSGSKTSEWAVDPFRVERIETTAEGARGSLVYHGRFAVCEAVLRVWLDWGSDRVECCLTKTYDTPSHEGFETLPLPLSVGSYLGGSCERPYVPAYTVESDVEPGQTRFYSNKPFGFEESVAGADGWSTGQYRELFDGLWPILGIDTGIAESPRGSQVLYSDGHNHFFRRCSDDSELLGLSLGVSAIHPQTQGYKLAPESPWERIGRHLKTDYANAHDTCDFVRSSGQVTTTWSWQYSSDPVNRAECRRTQLSRLVPLTAADEPLSAPLALAGADVIVTGIEAKGGTIAVRIVNYSDAPAPFRIAARSPIGSVDVSAGMPIDHLEVEGDSVAGVLPPGAVRELILPRAALFPPV